MTSDDMDDTKAEPLLVGKRRRFRFSLRTFFIACTLVCLALGLYFNSVQNERRAAMAIANAHGKVVYDWQIRPLGSDPSVQPEPPGPAWLRKYLGPHWFNRIVEVNLNGYINRGEKNRFAAVGPYLTKLPALRSLTLWGGELSDEDYRLLGRLTQLETLHLRQESVIQPQQMAALADAAGLRELSLSEVKTSPEALQYLAKLPRLETLKIECFFHDPNAGGINRKYQLRDDAAEVLGSFPKLRSLMLFATLITDEGMASFSRLSQLETLVVSSPNVTSASFDHVVKLERLKHLGTWQWKIDDADLKKLSQLPNLTSLGLVTNLTDESIPHVTALEHIERLTVHGEDITDESVHHFLRLSKLEWLDLSGTSIAKHGPAAKKLKQAFPKCLISLPKTAKEKEMERAFRDWKWGGGMDR